MSEIVRIRCGPYTLIGRGAPKPDTLLAEETYVVSITPGAPAPKLAGLELPQGAAEGRLRLGNFVGTLRLGGRRIPVESRRMSTDTFERLLGDVAARLEALPFAPAAPVGREIDRRRITGPDVLMHAFAVVRAAMRGDGPHDLREAVETILQRPHERLVRDDLHTVPLYRAEGVGPETILGILHRPERLARVPRGAPAAVQVLAERMGGVIPETVDVGRIHSTYDTVENRFVATMLETVVDVMGRVQRLARGPVGIGLESCAEEARQIEDAARRWLRHQVLADHEVVTAVPTESTVLRARRGYREFLSVALDLLGRTGLAPTATLATLLELRDAADLYELWCFFAVVDAATELVPGALELDAFQVDEVGARVPWGFRARIGDATIAYNQSFSRGTGVPSPGRDSYSLRLRPDVVVVCGDGSVHVLDAKLKLQFSESVLDVYDDETSASTFKPADVHKMHAYRDALGVRSAWVMFPGTGGVSSFAAPWSAADEGSGPSGVGAVPVLPDGPRDPLRAVMRWILTDVPGEQPTIDPLTG